MKISACIIVKNEEKILPITLPVLSRCVTEIILVDTGSSDNTIKIAQKFGAKVFRFAWINDFAAARNESLKHATGDWIIWLDADEFIAEGDFAALKLALANSKENAHSLPLFESKLGSCERHNGYERVKVFRNHQGYQFIRPINEQVVAADLKVVNGTVIECAIYHWGKHLAEERMREKRENYVRLYTQALVEQPDDPHLHFLLANNLSELKETEKALEHYVAAARIGAGKPIGQMGLEKYATLLLSSKKLMEAAETAQKLLEIDPDNIPARNIFGSIFLVTGKTKAAIAILTEVLAIKTGQGAADLYQNIAMPNFLLGKAYQSKGENDKAQFCFARAKAIAPALGG